MNTSRKVMEWLICSSIVNLMLGCLLFKKFKMTETRRLQNLVNFIQAILNFVLSRKITTNSLILYHHVIKGSRFLTIDKLASTEMQTILSSKVQNKLSSHFYLKNLFEDNDIDWIKIYMLPRLATYNTYMLSFDTNSSFFF